jgi:hypothetical protein
MELIKPSEIGAKITTLIEDASKSVLLVSPFNDIEGWPRLRPALVDAAARGVRLTLVHRTDKEVLGFEGVKISVWSVDNLHAKIYLNERYGIVGSMNLLRSSNERSLEIAYKTTLESEHEELSEFCQRYLKRPQDVRMEPARAAKQVLWHDYFDRNCRDALERGRLTANFHNGTLLLREYGFMVDGRRDGLWIWFDEDGRVSRTVFYANGVSKHECAVSFAPRATVSLYDAVFSIVNIMRQIYGRVSDGAYFDSELYRVTPDEGVRLLDTIERTFSVSIADENCWTISQLAQEIKGQVALGRPRNAFGAPEEAEHGRSFHVRR